MYQLVVQDERVRLTKAPIVDPTSDVLGFSVKVTAGCGRGLNEKPTCSHCDKVGHEVAQCWSLLVCSHCKKNGHEVGQCFELVGYPKGWEANRNSGSGRGRGPVKTQATSTMGILAVGTSSSSTPSTS